ncbi:hypothetical protein AURUGA1_00377 [Aurantimicrobium sp. MWH-Uga1]|nr:hypothetical protein AURUGA1_00377 [Aurantimicrobium sp. MWH-Uga1]
MSNPIDALKQAEQLILKGELSAASELLEQIEIQL